MCQFRVGLGVIAEGIRRARLGGGGGRVERRVSWGDGRIVLLFFILLGMPRLAVQTGLSVGTSDGPMLGRRRGGLFWRERCLRLHVRSGHLHYDFFPNKFQQVVDSCKVFESFAP